MLASWHNFFFVAYDPAGFVTVDKPPLALWIQALSARCFGYRPLSLILPQVLEGLSSVALLWWLLRRRFGALAALTGALLLALTPVAVAVDRYNNMDSCLGLLLLAAAVGPERGRGARTAGAAAAGRVALVGLAFNTKMMAAFVAPARLRRGLPGLGPGDLGAGAWATRSLAGLGPWRRYPWPGSWPVDLTLPERRPYVGSTQDNSMLGLSLGWNGLQRMTQRGRGAGRPQRLQPHRGDLGGRRGPEPWARAAAWGGATAAVPGAGGADSWARANPGPTAFLTGAWPPRWSGSSRWPSWACWRPGDGRGPRTASGRSWPSGPDGFSRSMRWSSASCRGPCTPITWCCWARRWRPWPASGWRPLWLEQSRDGRLAPFLAAALALTEAYGSGM